MNKGLIPFRILGAGGTLAIGLSLGAILIAVSQPWLGMSLAVDGDSGRIVIAAVDPQGPSAHVPVGQTLAMIGDLAVEPDDLAEDPDTLHSYADFSRMLDRQGHLMALLGGSAVAIALGPDAKQVQWVKPEPSRPVSSLPLTFWSQIMAGAFGLLIGVWVWSLRVWDLNAALMALAGVFIVAMIFPAAIYSTREIALDPHLFRWFAAIDHLGALGYGVAMVALFYLYPRRLVPLQSLWALPAVFGCWWVVDTAWLVFTGSAFGFYLPMFFLMMLFVPPAILQYRLTTDDPAMRAALRWFALSVGIGSGAAVSLLVVPNLMSIQPPLAQANAFLVFIIVFAGVAVGVARYRLFELEIWALYILFYLVGVILFVILDAILAYVVALERVPALGVSLIVIGSIYLPLRDTLWRRLARPPISRDSLFQQVIDIALSPPNVDQNVGWANLLKDTFKPLLIDQGEDIPAAAIVEDGIGLALPAIDQIGPVRLGYAQGGRKLFSRADQALANELCAMLRYASQSRQAREQGIEEERTRIARDIHDNIGAKLLSALHNRREEHKDTMIRDSLSDLRDIVNNTMRGSQSFDEVLAEVRAETADRLEADGIALTWETSGTSEVELPLAAGHTLRSIIREAVSNVIRHARATSVLITLRCHHGHVSLAVIDDGRGVAKDQFRSGNGLANIRARLDALKGDFDLTDADPGTRLNVCFPVRGEPGA